MIPLMSTLTHPMFGDFTPGQLQGMVAWYPYNRGITVAGAGVSVWADQSGEGNELLQATDSNRPSNYLKTEAFTLNQPTTVYLLAKQATWTNGEPMCDGGSSNSGMIRQTGTTPTIGLYAGISTALNTDLILDTYSVIIGIFNGASSALQINNNAETTGNAGANNMGGVTVGSKGGATNYSNFQFKEVIVYNTAHDDITRTKVINYLNLVGG